MQVIIKVGNNFLHYPKALPLDALEEFEIVESIGYGTSKRWEATGDPIQFELAPDDRVGECLPDLVILSKERDDYRDKWLAEVAARDELKKKLDALSGSVVSSDTMPNQF